MQIDSLMLFLAVVDYTNFSQAAFEKNISQSSLSKHIKNLEDEFGTKLFDRTSHQIKLTDAGKVFLEHAEIIVREYFALRKAMDSFNGTNKITVRIISTPVFHLYDFSTLIKEFLLRYPGIRIQINEAPMFSIVKELGRLSVDLALVRSATFPDKENYRFFTLVDDEIRFLCHNNHRLAQAEEVSIDDINKEELVLLNPAVYEYIELLKKDGFHIDHEKSYINVHNGFTISEYIQKIGFSSIMMGNMAEQLCKNNNIRSIPIKGRPQASLDIVVEKKHMSDGAKLFIEFATGFFKKRRP